MIVVIRTDKPDAQVGLYNQDATERRMYQWHADRQLSKDLLKVIHDQLRLENAGWSDIRGVVVFKGPGSFTGLRIGITVANAIAYGRRVPIVATQDDGWVQDGIARLQKGQTDQLA